MRKLISIITVITMVAALTGCSSKVKLEEDQMHFNFDKDDGITLTALIDDKDLEDDMDIDFDDKVKEIEEDIQDYLDDEDQDGELISFKKDDDMGLVEIYYDDLDELYMELDNSLEDYADDMYGDFDDFADEEEFIYYKNEKDVDEDDLEDYEDYYVVSVYGGEDGIYYTFPSKIILVHEDVDYEKISDNTIFIEDSTEWNGVVIIEEY